MGCVCWATAVILVSQLCGESESRARGRAGGPAYSLAWGLQLLPRALAHPALELGNQTGGAWEEGTG